MSQYKKAHSRCVCIHRSCKHDKDSRHLMPFCGVGVEIQLSNVPALNSWFRALLFWPQDNCYITVHAPSWVKDLIGTPTLASSWSFISWESWVASVAPHEISGREFLRQMDCSQITGSFHFASSKALNSTQGFRRKVHSGSLVTSQYSRRYTADAH